MKIGKGIYSKEERGENMAAVTKTLLLPAKRETVWNTVTSLDAYAWRSDLSKIEVLEEGKIFVEYTTKGVSTRFTISAWEPMQHYAFTMENDNMQGNWSGRFSDEGDYTLLICMENVRAKKWFMRPFVKGYLRRQQAQYGRDLQRELMRQREG